MIKKRKGIPLILTIAVIFVAYLAVKHYGMPGRLNAPANSIIVLQPYKAAGTWVFDDFRTGLVREPFVSGIPEIIDRLVSDIPNAEKGFRLLFSANSFPGYHIKLIWRRAESGGNWYYCEQYKIEGWLCPSLFRYFKEAPRELYAKAEAK